MSNLFSLISIFIFIHSRLDIEPYQQDLIMEPMENDSERMTFEEDDDENGTHLFTLFNIELHHFFVFFAKLKVYVCKSVSLSL